MATGFASHGPQSAVLVAEAKGIETLLRRPSPLREDLQQVVCSCRPLASRASEFGGGRCRGAAAPLDSAMLQSLSDQPPHASGSPADDVGSDAAARTQCGSRRRIRSVLQGRCHGERVKPDISKDNIERPPLSPRSPGRVSHSLDTVLCRCADPGRGRGDLDRRVNRSSRRGAGQPGVALCGTRGGNAGRRHIGTRPQDCRSMVRQRPAARESGIRSSGEHRRRISSASAAGAERAIACSASRLGLPVARPVVAFRRLRPS